MTTRLHIGIAVSVAVLAASGCVSSGEFEKAQAAKNSVIQSMQEQQASLEQENAALKQQKSSLEAAQTTLKQQLAAAQAENAAMQQKATAMQQQLAATEQKTSESLAAQQDRQQRRDALAQALATATKAGTVEVRQYPNMVALELSERPLFDAGRAVLKPSGKELLKSIAQALKAYDSKLVRVVAHTDNTPVTKALRKSFDTNWEFSVARSTNVVRYLQELGVAPERLVAAGRSQYDPVSSNDTAEGRQKNRRVEIILMDQGSEGDTAKPAQ